ncbi:MAG TPA: hypothetical protein VGO00_14410 [Kofleriaceae bacterium]|jgi:hypothetical protein|nr:hypothetical protein [Kofleriaceae bacterium]
MGDRRTAHTVRSRKAGPTSQLGDDQLQRLIKASHDSDRAKTTVGNLELEAEIEVVEPEPTPPPRFADGSTVEEVILLTEPRREPSTWLWVRVTFVMLATAWIVARFLGA